MSVKRSHPNIPVSGETSECNLEADESVRQSTSCIRSGSGCSYYDDSSSAGEQTDCHDGDARDKNGGARAQSRGRDTSEPLSINEEADGWPSSGANAFTTTLFSGTPADVSEKTWWLFCARMFVFRRFVPSWLTDSSAAVARESTTDFQPSPSGATFQ